MNKFEGTLAKLCIYFQTRVFYVFKQNKAIWKKYIVPLPGADPQILLYQMKA